MRHPIDNVVCQNRLPLKHGTEQRPAHHNLSTFSSFLLHDGCAWQRIFHVRCTFVGSHSASPRPGHSQNSERMLDILVDRARPGRRQPMSPSA